MNKKVLIIGAGVAQVDAIKKAKDMGYYILASDGSAEAEGLKIADESRVIDVKDIGANYQWAKEADVGGVLSYASDVTLPTVLAIREKMNLPGLGRVPMEVSLDKSQQRQRFKNANLSQPFFNIVEDLKGLDAFESQRGVPLVVKPVDNAGSRGVTLVFQRSQLKDACEVALANSQKKQMIVEEFIDGIELTVEGFSINGEHHVLAISDKFKPEGSYRVATQLAYPAAISKEEEIEVIKLIERALTVAEVDNTPTHSEIILSKEGPKIIEIGCRGGGFYVFTRVVEAVSGYDIVANWTRMCMGDALDPLRTERNGVVLRFYTAPPGKRLIKVEGLEKAKSMEGVETDLFLSPGDIIPKLKTDGSRTGWMIVSGKDRNEAVKKADQVSALVKFHVEEI